MLRIPITLLYFSSMCWSHQVFSECDYQCPKPSFPTGARHVAWNDTAAVSPTRNFEVNIEVDGVNGKAFSPISVDAVPGTILHFALKKPGGHLYRWGNRDPCRDELANPHPLPQEVNGSTVNVHVESSSREYFSNNDDRSKICYRDSIFLLNPGSNLAGNLVTGTAPYTYRPTGVCRNMLPFPHSDSGYIGTGIMPTGTMVHYSWNTSVHQSPISPPIYSSSASAAAAFINVFVVAALLLVFA